MGRVLPPPRMGAAASTGAARAARAALVASGMIGPFGVVTGSPVDSSLGMIVSSRGSSEWLPHAPAGAFNPRVRIAGQWVTSMDARQGLECQAPGPDPAFERPKPDLV
jgi:hypothetical protein